MSENGPQHNPNSPEHAHHHVDHHKSHEHQEHQKPHQEHEQAPEHKLQGQIDQIREEAHEAAQETSETRLDTADADKLQDQPYLGNAELKDMTFSRTLTRVQKDLTPVQRTFSKVVHQPIVDAFSEVGGKTVARPSGILAGGLTAFVGTSLVLYVCKHYGYSYNFLLFALLFVAGFFVGLLFELGFRVMQARRA